jgi:hypothetical protein
LVKCNVVGKSVIPGLRCRTHEWRRRRRKMMRRTWMCTDAV